MVRVIQGRVFLPYRIYIDSASHFYDEFKIKGYVSWHDLIATITLLGLSVEAIANTLGELTIPNFKDFKSCSPKAKLRLLCEKAGIEFEYSESLYKDIIDLLKIRNKLAHPKFQMLHYQSRKMPLNLAQEHYHEIGEVLHVLESSLTPEFAEKSLKAVLDLERLLRGAIEPKLYESSTKKLILDDEEFGFSPLKSYKFKS